MGLKYMKNLNLRKYIRCVACSAFTLSWVLLLLLVSLAFSPPVFAMGGDLLWSRTDAAAGKQEARAMIVDSAGNTIVAGYTGSNANDYYVAKFKADGTGMAWPEPAVLGGSGEDIATAVTVDSKDNIIVTGYTWNGSDRDIFTIKYCGSADPVADCAGKEPGKAIWQHTLTNTSGNDSATSIAVDNFDNIYVAGSYFNGVKTDDFVVIKYPSAGAVPTWVEIYDDPANPNKINRVVAMTVKGSAIAVTGYSGRGTTFDILTRTYGLDQSFIRQWRHSDSGDCMGKAVRMDSAGNVIITGSAMNAVNNKDIFTAKYNPASDTPVWEKTYNGNSTDEPTGLWVDSAGYVYVTGVTNTLSGNEDFFSACYDGDTGELKWKSIFDAGNDATDIPVGIVVDEAADGGVFVTGYTTVSGNDDFMTLKYRKDTGGLLWENKWNGSDNKNDRTVGIALEPAGGPVPRAVYVVGWSDSSTNGYDFQIVKYDHGALNAPSALTAKADSETSITLTWYDNSINEEKFVIERKLGESGVWGAITPDKISPAAPNDTTITPAVPATTYTDSTGLAANNYYYYRVRAWNSANIYSDYSNEARALTKVVSYATPSLSETFLYNGADNLDDVATAITFDSDNHPVVTGYSDLTEEGVEDSFSYDYMTFKLDRSNMAVKWKARYDSGDGGTDMAAGVALDSAGNVLVTGTAYLAGGGDKSDDLYTRKVATAGLNDPAVEPGLLWDHQYGTLAGIDLATAIAMIRDGSNNSVVIGYGGNAAGNDDIFIIKYDNSGGRPWAPLPTDPQATIYDSGRNDHPSAVAIDASGNIFVTGYSYDTATTGSHDWYTAKYNGSTGALIWSDVFDSGFGDDKALSLDLDRAGNVYVSGFAKNSAGNTVFHTIKYDGALVPAGERKIWSASYNKPGFDARAVAVKVDPIDSGVVVGGSTYLSSTDSDFHLIRYNPADGSEIWNRNFDRPGYDYATAMAMDASGYIYLAGNSRSGPDTDILSDPGSDVLSLIYDHEGTYLGAMSYDKAGLQDEATAITVNYRGEAFVAGFASRAADNTDYIVFKQTNPYLLVPGPFAATAQADYTKVDLTWQVPARDIPPSFRIYRTTGPSNSLSEWSLVASPAAGVVAYTDVAVPLPGTSYCYTIEAIAGTLNSRKTEACVTTKLQKPTLTLTVDSTTQITLNWNQIAGNTGYKIERKIGAGAWADLTTKPGDLNFHVDSGLTPGTTYYYRVSTNSAVGYSLPSNEPIAVTRPLAPTLNAPTGVTNTQMVLGWAAVTGAATYTLQKKLSTDPVESYTDILTPDCTEIAATSCTVSGLTPNETYAFRVKAINTGGESAWSIEQTRTAALAVPTWAATTPTLRTNASMTFTWVNPVVSGSGTITYTLQYRLSTGSYADETTASACSGTTSLACSVTGLTPNRIYYYRIKASNASGSSSWSTEKSGMTLLDPSVLSSATGGALMVDLAWSAVAEATGYTIQQATCTDSTNPATCRGTVGTYLAWGDKATGVVPTTYSATALAAGTNYRYQISATVAGNSSAFSNILHAWTNLTSPTLTITPASSTALTLNWDAQPGETNYTVEVSTTGIDGTYAEIPAATGLARNTITYPHTGLALETEYCYKVKAYSTEAIPPPAVYSTPQCKTTPPNAPVLAVPTVVSTTQINLSWNQVAGNSGYEIERCVTTDNNQPVTHPLGTCTNLAPKIAQDQITFDNTGLIAGYSYRYRVRAWYNASVDFTAWSNEYWATTIPPAPIMVTPTVASTTTVQLTPTWNNVLGDNGYKLYWKERSGANCTDGTWNGPIALGINVITYNHAGRTPGTYYCYQIIASGPSGPPVTPDSASSNVVFQTTKPAQPVLNALSGITASNIDLSWSNVTGNTGYKIERKTGVGGTYTTVITTAADITSYSNGGLAAGTQYYYRISANSAGGFSAVSSEQYATTTPVATTVTLAVISESQVDLSWPVVLGAESYKVERKEGAGAYAEVIDLPVGYSALYCGETYPTVGCPAVSPIISIYQDAGLAGNTSYCYQIKSWNSTGGNSTPSTEKCIATLAIPKQNLIATALDGGFRIRLDWTPIECTPNPCEAPTGYEIQRLVRDGNWVPLKTIVGGETLTYTDSLAIDPGKQYRYRVRSVSGTDKSTFSEAMTYAKPYSAVEANICSE